MSRVKTYLACPEYVIRLEDEQGHLFIHLDVYKWSKAIVHELRDEFDKIKKKAHENGYNYISTYTHNPKFVRMFGGIKTMTFKEYEVFSWELK